MIKALGAPSLDPSHPTHGLIFWQHDSREPKIAFDYRIARSPRRACSVGGDRCAAERLVFSRFFARHCHFEFDFGERRPRMLAMVGIRVKMSGIVRGGSDWIAAESVHCWTSQQWHPGLCTTALRSIALGQSCSVAPRPSPTRGEGEIDGPGSTLNTQHALTHH